MGLIMRERHAIIRELAPRFQRATSKKERSQILDQCVNITGYTRWYAAYALRLCGKKLIRMVGKRRVVFVPGHARAPGASRKRRRQYNSPMLLEALTFFWAISDGLCDKRLFAFIDQTLPLLERDSALPWLEKDPGLRAQLLKISPASIDRLLVDTKARTQLKGRSTTRPGTLLKYHIPVRTFADWNENEPGFCEVDLVAHDGGSPYGEFIQSLNLTDVASSWTEPLAVQNKAQCHVFAGLQQIRQQLPFALLGIDSDNGSEFINHTVAELLNKLLAEQTKSRPRHSNDNGLAESKNGAVVRKHMGYGHIRAAHAEAINEFYREHFNPYLNFHRPCGVPEVVTGTKGKQRRIYRWYATPWEILRQLPDLARYMKADLTVALMNQRAGRESDTASARRMQQEKKKLFDTFGRRQTA